MKKNFTLIERALVLATIAVLVVCTTLFYKSCSQFGQTVDRWTNCKAKVIEQCETEKIIPSECSKLVNLKCLH